MKANRFRYSYRKSASKLHRMVGNLLRELFTNTEVYQEYPVVRINKDYSESSHHYDWVVPKLKLVIECHGKQHYEPVAFGGDDDLAVANFQSQKLRDNAKKTAALEAGFTFVEISYRVKRLSGDDLLRLIDLAREEQKGYTCSHDTKTSMAEDAKTQRSNQQKEARERYLRSDAHQVQLEKARQYRREQYRRLKELKDGRE